MPRALFRSLLLAALALVAVRSAAALDDRDREFAQRGRECDKLFVQWRRTRDPRARARLGGELIRAAIQVGERRYVEEVAADGKLSAKELRFPRRPRTVPLRELRTFDGIETSPSQEDGYHVIDDGPDPSTAKGWLVRRITHDAWEVWTPTHGWLFDAKGQVLNEARPIRGDGTGREWYGAFLPDGRWVTTDLQEHDDRLTFFSRDGQRLRQLTSAELAPYKSEDGSEDTSLCLLGWARSDKDGSAWVVNVGDNQGYATVRVGPEGPARVLGGIERWGLCRPRALGPRGWYISLDVPDDAGQTMLNRRVPGHGMGLGYPEYRLSEAKAFSLQEVPDYEFDEDPASDEPVDGVVLPDGNDVFGFWPGGQDLFICTEKEFGIGGPKLKGGAEEYPDVDKTWFFDRRWRLQGWTRARRLADAADGRSMLLRTDGDGRIVTLGPDQRASEVRRFVWPDGKTADAVTLFDDLRLGLFVRRSRLVLAGW